MQTSQSYESFMQSLNISPAEAERVAGVPAENVIDYAPPIDFAARIEDMRKATAPGFAQLGDDEFGDDGLDEIECSEAVEEATQGNDDDDIPTDVLGAGEVVGMMSANAALSPAVKVNLPPLTP